MAQSLLSAPALVPAYQFQIIEMLQTQSARLSQFVVQRGKLVQHALRDAAAGRRARAACATVHEVVVLCRLRTCGGALFTQLCRFMGQQGDY